MRYSSVLSSVACIYTSFSCFQWYMGGNVLWANLSGEFVLVAFTFGMLQEILAACRSSRELPTSVSFSLNRSCSAVVVDISDTLVCLRIS